MATNLNKALAMLSIAAKAGKVVSGSFMTERALQEGTAELVLISCDASQNTRKKFTDKCTYYSVPYRIVSDSKTLGGQIGRQSRITAAVTDAGLARQIINRLDDETNVESE